MGDIYTYWDHEKGEFVQPSIKVEIWFEDSLEASLAREKWFDSGKLKRDDKYHIYLKDVYSSKRGWGFYDQELGTMLKLTVNL